MPTTLSLRDKNLLTLIALGYDNEGIESMLRVQSANGLVYRLCQRFGAKTRVHLLALAYHEGQLPPPEECLPEIERISHIRLLDAEHNHLLLLAYGNSQEDAAGYLGMAPSTFSDHQATIVDKIGVPPRVTNRPRRNYVVAHALWAGILRLDRKFVDPSDPDERQRRLLQQLATGDSDVQTGAALGMRPTSADHETQKIQLRWGCATRAELLQLTTSKGWITVPQSRWPSVVAMLQYLPSDDEYRLLGALGQNISRERAAQDMGIPTRTYRRIYRDMCARYHTQTKSQLLATLLLAKAVHEAWYLPIGARYLNSAFVPSENQNKLIAGLASGRMTGDIHFSGGSPTAAVREAEKKAMMDFFGVDSLWHLIAVLHSAGQLPVPFDLEERRKIEMCIIHPPTEKVHVVLAKLAAGQSVEDAMQAARISVREFNQGLAIMGVTTLTQGVAMFCWVGDSWRGR